MEGIPGVLLLKYFGGVTVLYRRQSNQAFRAYWLLYFKSFDALLSMVPHLSDPVRSGEYR